MNSGCLVLPFSLWFPGGPQQGDGEPVDLGWSPTFRTPTLSEKQAPSSHMSSVGMESRHWK